MLLVMYYQCLFDYVKLDCVYVFVDGCIVCFGGFELVIELECIGYGKLVILVEFFEWMLVRL